MYKLLNQSKSELISVILATSSKKGISPAIIEKDFWVCVVLDYLFHYSKWKNHIAFKGGTCLSKAYGLIERFSEDIDLILDWTVLGYGKNEPWEERSNTKQLKFIEDSKVRLFNFLENEFLPEFKLIMRKLIGESINAYIDEYDKGTVIFAFPSIYNDSSILKVIKLEIGVLSSWSPVKTCLIKPYIVEEFPNANISGDILVLATTPERTFWEKATILHQESYRPEGSNIPLRYSRHYYDLYCMYHKNVLSSALKDIELLENVSLFKSKFYPRGWARYDLAKQGTLRLMPAHHSLDRLRKDYFSMKSMIYGTYPSFDEILETIREMESLINEDK